MKVKDFIRDREFVTDRTESLADAAERMRLFDIGALPVVDGRQLVGIVTERDIVRAVADRARLELTPAAEYMTSWPATIGPEATLEHAAAIMATLGVRHLPVVDRGELVGMVSIRDVVTKTRDIAGSHVR